MNKSILVIDDSKSIREVVKTTLIGAGYKVAEAHDGQDALEKLGNENWQLIICDVNMPRMDGISFLQNLQTEAYSAFKYTPVLMLTTENSQEMKESGRAAGAKAWLVKPFVPEKLVRAVEKLSA